MKKFLLSLMALFTTAMFAFGEEADIANTAETADQVIYDWNFQAYGSTIWLPVNAEAESVTIAGTALYPTTVEKWAGIYAESEKIRLDKNTGIRAYTQTTGNLIGIPGLKKGDIIEVTGNAGGGSGTDPIITSVTDNAQLTANAWNDFTITMTADGDLGINEVYYQQTASNWYSIATIKVTRPAPGPELVNPAFDANADDIITVTTQGYTRNITGDQIAGLQPVTGWTAGEQTESDPGYAGGVFAYGSENLLNNKVAAPATDPDGNAGVALGLAAVWGGVAQYTQEITLPAGDYTLTYPIYNAVNTGAVTKNLFGFIADDGTEYLSDQKTFTVGEWENVEVALTLSEETTGKVSIGFIGSGGSGNAPHLFIDHVALAKAPGIDVAIANLDKAIEAAQAELAKYSNGDGLFQYPTAELAPLTVAIQGATLAKMAEDATKASINEATETLNAAVEAFAPKQNAPDPEQAYILTLTTSEDESQLSATTEGITIAAEGTPIYFIAQEDGTYALSNGTEYINYAGGDNWTLNASSEPYGWAIAVVEGGYTITGKNGLLGTNAADKTAGKPCYGDKKTTNGNYIWALEEAASSDATDMTSLIKNPAYLEKGEDGTANYAGWTYSENAWKARNYDAPLILITYSGNAAFEVSQTIESVPAGHYLLTVNAFYRAGSLDDEKAKVAAGTELEKELSFYADVANGQKYTEKVMNLTEGATETNYNDGAQLENGLYVPNSANDARAWYIADEYSNALEFDVYEDGAVTIGLSKTEGLPSDYCPIGGWSLIRLGDAEAPAGITYTGIVEQTLTHPVAGEMGKTTEEQTITIAEAGEGLVNITFSGFTLPMAALGAFPEFTIKNVAVETAEDGTITYSAGNFQVSMPRGQMTVNYNAELTGEQADAEATPVLHLTLTNATIDDVYFGADQDAIDAYKKAQEPEEIYIETDLTSSFTALTVNTNWTTGAGNTAGYTATNFCPAVTTNAGQTVQVCEFYEASCNRTGDLLYQTVTGLAAGTYTIELYGAAAYTFNRGFSSTAFSEGEWNDGDKIDSDTGVTLYAETSEGTYGGEIPIYYACDFPNGAATVVLEDVVIGEDGSVKIGMSKTSTSTNWHVIQLKGVTAKVLATEALAIAVANAEAIEESSVPAAVYDELTAAVEANNQTYTTAEDYEAAIAAINAATNKATIYAAAGGYFNKMGAVLEQTNVYTEEAYDAYYGTWLAGYEAGTLENEVLSTLTENTAYSSGWHSANNIDDVLLSTWTVGGDQCKDYGTALYINTWSVEGNSDGTEFYTPFFEYWTGDGDSLGATELQATVTGLEANATYDVTIWTRVRYKNYAEDAPYGITLSVGEGEAVDVCAGEAVEGSQFYIGEFTAQGAADAEGNLTITYTIAEDNNVSWLSFKNANYVYNENVTVGINGIGGTTTVKNGKYLEDGKVVIIKNGAKYNVNGAAIK